MMYTIFKWVKLAHTLTLLRSEDFRQYYMDNNIHYFFHFLTLDAINADSFNGWSQCKK